MWSLWWSDLTSDVQLCGKLSFGTDFGDLFSGNGVYSEVVSRRGSKVFGTPCQMFQTKGWIIFCQFI